MSLPERCTVCGWMSGRRPTTCSGDEEHVTEPIPEAEWTPWQRRQAAAADEATRLRAKENEAMSNLSGDITETLLLAALQFRRIRRLTGKAQTNAEKALVTEVLGEINDMTGDDNPRRKSFLSALIAFVDAYEFTDAPKPVPVPVPLPTPTPAYGVPHPAPVPSREVLKAPVADGGFAFTAEDTIYVTGPAGGWWVVQQAGTSAPLIGPPIGGTWELAGVIG